MNSTVISFYTDAANASQKMFWNMSILWLMNICAIAIILWIWIKRKQIIVQMRLPGPFTIPIIGSVKLMLEVLKDGHHYYAVRKYFDANPSVGIIRAWMGPQFYVIARDPEYVQMIHQKSVIAKPPTLNWLHAMGNGLLTMTTLGKDSSWKEHKKILHPTLNANIFKYYYDFIQKHSAHTVISMKEICNQGIVDFGPYVSRYAADVAAEALFGADMKFREGRRDTVFDAVKTMSNSVYKRNIFIWLAIEFLYNMTEIGKRQKEATRILREFCQELYKLGKENMINAKNLREYDKTTTAVLAKNVEEGNMREKEAIDEVMNIWIAASDTVGSALGFIPLILGINKNAQDKVFLEIKEYYKSDRNADVCYEDVENFPFLEACIKECLRLISPGATSLRYTTEDLKIGDDIVIPPGTYFMTSSFLTHRNYKVWADPDSFIPERFCSEEIKNKHPCSFIPFSYGPRMCAGSHLARYMMKVCLIYLLREYEFQCDWKLEDIPLYFDIHVRSKWGYKMKITSRTWD